MSDDPVAKNEALEERAALELAATWLKATPLFAHMSRRLLFDLVERNGLRPTEPGAAGAIEEAPAHDLVSGPFLAVVVLAGAVQAINRDPPEGDNSTAKSVLRVGAHLRGDLPLGRISFGSLVLEAADHEKALVVTITSGSVRDTPSSAWSLDFDSAPIPDPPARTPPNTPPSNIPPPTRAARRPELIWVSSAIDASVPVDAAMHILGAAVARQSAVLDPQNPLHVVLLILGPHFQRLVWRGGRFHADPVTTPADTFLLLDPAGQPIEHVAFFIGNPDHPAEWPHDVFGNKVDRIVHLTTMLPKNLLDGARRLLHGSLSHARKESFFSSFIATVLVGEKSSFERCAERICGGAFDTLALPCGVAGESTRLYRDAVVLKADTSKLDASWSEWIKKGPEQDPPFIDVDADAGGMVIDTTKRWARAVTNRRIGVAFSGGGASAYRGGPLLKRLKRKLPIDVVAALSGGSLLGAYYSHSEMNGFRTMKRMALMAQLGLPAVFVTTLPVETTTDFVLGHTRVEELEIRLAAVAVELPDTETPRTVVVRRGTLGEAIRVSGALPPTFAPTSKNCMRYTDGGAGCLVPAQVARDCGADVVLACNLIPGPALGNPYAGISAGAGLLRLTPIFGRLIDSYTWSSYLLCQGSRVFSAHAEAYVEFKPQAFPALESTLFIAAERIIADAESQGDMLDESVAKLEKAWKRLGTPK